MVNNVVLNDAMEEMASDEAEVSVHCCKGTLDESPMLCLKMRHVGMGMVQIGDGDLTCALVGELLSKKEMGCDLPSQWCTQM